MTEVERQNLKASQDGPDGFVVMRETAFREMVANRFDERPHGFARLTVTKDVRHESRCGGMRSRPAQDFVIVLLDLGRCSFDGHGEFAAC